MMHDHTAIPTTARARWRDGGRDDESVALLAAMAAFVISGVAALCLFWGRELEIDGRGSVGDCAAIASAAATTMSFVAAQAMRRGAGDTRAGKPQPSADGSRYRWFDLAALSLAHGVIALLGWIGIATVMEQSFVGATVYATPAAVLVAAATALSAYLAYLSGTNVSPRRLSVVLAVFLVAGMVTAMLSSADPLWWQKNLSALGITHDVSSLAFNLTLIVSGVIITTIARLGTESLPNTRTVDARRRALVRTLLVLLGVFLACVGVFPVDRFFLAHNTVATGMTIVFAVLVIALPWLIPSMPKVFVLLGFVYVGVIIALAVLFALGIYNLTAVELVAALLIFSWIILFLRNVETNGQPVARHVSGKQLEPSTA